MTITAQRRILAPPARVFDAVRDIALHARAVPWIHARVEAGRQEGWEQDGEQITWSARYFGRRWQQTMETRLVSPPWKLVQDCVVGPWQTFHHEWTLIDATGPEGQPACLLTDAFTFRSPHWLGPAGPQLDRHLFRPQLQPALECWVDAIARHAAR